MDETSKQIILGITRQFDTPQLVKDNLRVKTFYDCSKLTPNDLARLAAEATGHLDENAFDMVVGLAYTGILFSFAVARGRLVSILATDGSLIGTSVKDRRVLVVDDVVCSGTRLATASEQLRSMGANIVGYACIIDRSAGSRHPMVSPLWSAWEGEVVDG
ncbi:MAG: phosphoribosyltransferase family protein [Bdellovibrionota bacterium]|nr:MAG: phosphoribosyltransferase family protein [Bdellovibrionota bacterium]